MNATRFFYLHYEEFSYLLVSQALPQSKLGSLGPKPRPTLQALPHIPKQGLLGPTGRKPPLGFTVYHAIDQKGFLGHLRQHNPRFTATHNLAQGSLGQWLYRDPQSDSRTTRPYALYLEIHPTHCQIHLEILLNQNMRTPSHHGYSEMTRLG